MMRERPSSTARSTGVSPRAPAARPVARPVADRPPPGLPAARPVVEAHRGEAHRGEPGPRCEVLDSARAQACPARPPHADRHFLIGYAIGAHLAPGYAGATDLGCGDAGDPASDTSVRRMGVDEGTGERHPEELVFEVAFLQRRAALAERARRLIARGVRRVFAVLVDEDAVVEWCPSEQAWLRLDAGGYIEDPCLHVSLPVDALLDAEAADEAVARALIARGHPLLVAFGEACYRRGLGHGHQGGRAGSPR